MANLKTNEDYFNKDNFVERDGVMQEIVVSVTLAEYRDLVAGKAQLQQKVWDQNERIRKLEEEIKGFEQDNASLRKEVSYHFKERCALEAELEHARFGDVKGQGEDANE